MLIVNLLKTVKRISRPDKKSWFVDTIEYYLEKSEVLSFAGETKRQVVGRCEVQKGSHCELSLVHHMWKSEI